MHEKERRLYQQRVETFLKRLRGLYYEEEIPLNVEYCNFGGGVSFAERLQGRYRRIQPGEVWGENWDQAWFHLSGTVPRSWKGEGVVARINSGGEGLLFSPDGNPLLGLSHHTIWPGDHFCRDRVILFHSAAGGEEVDLWLESTAGELFGLALEEDRGDRPPEVYGHYQARFQYAVLSRFRIDIWHLYLDVLVLNELMLALPEQSVRRGRILRALNQCVNCFLGDEESTAMARSMLARELQKPASPSDLTTRAVGHAHLDTAWLWPIQETIRKCARTFSSQIQLLESYPDYVFAASQPQQYAFVKEWYPSLYAKMKRYVADGRWEPVGGMWVEADCNLIGGESMVRQIVHGKSFFQQEFGVEVKNLWLPDVFGFSAALPQILKKSGMDYLVTLKLSWNQFNRFPYHTFRWRGIDGSEVIVHFPPEDDYNSRLLPSRLRYAQENFTEKDFLDEFLTLFGIGDGGSGPTPEMIEAGIRQRDLEGAPRVIFSSAQLMLEQLDPFRNMLPVWVGELYLELHRGTYTTHAEIKKMNRCMELKLREIEILYSLLPLTFYPQKELERMWKKILLFQFHDILPGSSIPPVYQECRREYESLVNRAQELLDECKTRLLLQEKDHLCVINTLSVPYTRPISLPCSWLNAGITDEYGHRVVVQKEEDHPVVQIDIPPLSSLTLRKVRRKRRPVRVAKPVDFILENDQILYEFNQQGTLQRAYDKEMHKEILAEEGSGNVLCLYEDRPVNWDAWEIEIFYEDQMLEQARLLSQEWLYFGPVRQVIRQRFAIGSSSITQWIILSNNSKRLDFDTAVDLQENHKMLRVSFSIVIRAEFATFEIQYGHLYRPTHRNTSWERARFEVIGHRFADLSDENYGVALLNDCKYGYKVHENVLDLNLLRSPTMPDPATDRGTHRFVYSFFPHANRMVESDVLSEAAQLNQPPMLADGFTGKNLLFPVKLDSGNVILEVLKKAERESALILRLYEPRGKTVVEWLQFCKTDLEVFETDLLERVTSRLVLSEGKLCLTFQPFEIKTLMVKG